MLRFSAVTGVTCTYIVHPAVLYRTVQEALVYVFGAGTFIGENWEEAEKKKKRKFLHL